MPGRDSGRWAERMMGSREWLVSCCTGVVVKNSGVGPDRKSYHLLE